MDMKLAIGMTQTATLVVEPRHTAAAVGSGDLEVFSTPMMAALMEQAAAAALRPALPAEKTSVGISLQIAHTSATPVGMRVEAVATVTKVGGSRVEFSVTARDEAGEIGSGTHTRVVVDRARFLEKTAAKTTT
jgi:fluoroacetyl-CoA thioesterase